MILARTVFLRLAKAVAGLLALTALLACVQVYRNSGMAPLPGTDQSALRVATYNVHYIIVRRETGSWSLGDWQRRKDPLSAAFSFIGADLIAFQEMESFSGREADQDNLALDWLLEQHPDYAAAAVGDPAVFPSTQPFLYRRDRLKMTDQGWFFFSDTPDVIYSRTFNGSYPAFASWAAFTDRRTGAAFRAVNIHTDFKSRSNRLQSAALVAKRIAPWVDAGETLLVMGDMNGRLGDQTLEILREAGVTFAPVSGATFHFDRGLNLFGAIDHIGWAGAAETVSAPAVIRQQFLGEWPSDHYPVVLDLRLGSDVN
jgi:endonuclease/exonuclease/phosphatase family metal-dependent hydrolase